MLEHGMSDHPCPVGTLRFIRYRLELEEADQLLQLPATSRFGVYLAYVYYFSLFKKIKQTPCHKVQEKRIRVNAMEKLVLLFKSSVRMKLNML